MKSQRVRAFVAWGVVGLMALGTLGILRQPLAQSASVSDYLFLAMPAVFAAAGAIIYIRQPRNVIGWLLFIAAVGSQVGAFAEVWLSAMAGPPTHPTLLTYTALVVAQQSWMAIFFPVFVLLLVFPTGRVVSPRWRWLLWLAAGMVACLTLLGVFAREMTYGDPTLWSVPNPIGFVPSEFFAERGTFQTVWSMGLVTLVVGGVTSSVVRFRRAGPVERQQITWLLYAFAVFGVVYIVAAVFNLFAESSLFGVVLWLSLLTIPVAMTVAVLRYRLFDIDVIIRRTVTYVVVVGLLVAVYFGLVIGLGTLLPLRGEPLIAGSTLVVALLFLPLVRRAQRTVDRRFFRTRYEASAVVARMAQELRGSLALPDVVDRSEAVVTEVFSPVVVGVWIADE